MDAGWSPGPGMLGPALAQNAPSPFSTPRSTLPLNLVAHIIEYVDDPSDLAALTRTSKIMYYMTLPKLYDKVSLRSFSEIQYRNGRPRGLGNGSPFAVGLYALISGNVAHYSRRFYLCGDWSDRDIDDYAKGQIPDNDMMLNLSIKAAIDKMTRLEHFRWELSNTKPLHAVYQSLATRDTLRTLVIRFPITKIPRPQVLIPGIPSLKSFVAYDMDPMCSPDDISLVLSDSPQLSNVTLHWHQRVRVEQETIPPHAFLGRCIAENRAVNIKNLAIYNMYTPTMTVFDFDAAFNVEDLRSLTFVNTIVNDPRSAFANRAWRSQRPPRVSRSLKFYRGDILDISAYNYLEVVRNLEEIYYIGSDKIPGSTSNSLNSTPSGSSNHSVQNFAAPHNDWVSIASSYVAAIQTNHSHSLKALLLCDRWLFNLEVVCNLLGMCPNLRQFGTAMSNFEPENLSEIVKAAPKLFALRIIFPPNSELLEIMQSIEMSIYEQLLGHALAGEQFQNLHFFGVGNYIFELGDSARSPFQGTCEKKKPFRMLRTVNSDKVRDIGIWRYDTAGMVNDLILE